MEAIMTKKELLSSVIEKLDFIKPDMIPNIDLYMDQVTTFMDSHLEASKRYPDDKILTKTMINNYAKNDLLPPPIKKKYSKEHMFILIFIYYLKNILSIGDIQTLLNPLTEGHFTKENKSKLSLEEIYKEIFQLEKEQFLPMQRDVLKKHKRSQTMFSDMEHLTSEELEFLQTFSFVCMLSFDVYLKKQLIEKIVDDMNVKKNASAKNTDKKK